MNYQELVNECTYVANDVQQAFEQYSEKVKDTRYKKAADFVCEYFRGYLEHDDDGISEYVNKLDSASFDPEACTVLLANTILGSLSITNTICYTNNNCSMLCFSEQLCSEILENLVLRFRLIIYAVTDREFYESIVDENEVKRIKEMI